MITINEIRVNKYTNELWYHVRCKERNAYTRWITDKINSMCCPMCGVMLDKKAEFLVRMSQFKEG